jgi:hypothetical protein
MDMEHQELLKTAQEAGNSSIKRMRVKRMKNQQRIKTLPHGYYHNPSVREMYQQMVASVDDDY